MMKFEKRWFNQNMLTACSRALRMNSRERPGRPGQRPDLEVPARRAIEKMLALS